jgi:hypothetical protein
MKEEGRRKKEEGRRKKEETTWPVLFLPPEGGVPRRGEGGTVL